MFLVLDSLYHQHCQIDAIDALVQRLYASEWYFCQRSYKVGSHSIGQYPCERANKAHNVLSGGAIPMRQDAVALCDAPGYQAR